MPVQRVTGGAGNLINDNSGQSDRLNYHVYAETLAQSLHNTPAPLTVGIFGSWGIGKTFVAKRVQGLLKKIERRESVRNERHKSQGKETTRISRNVLEHAVFFFMFCILILTVIFISADRMNSDWLQLSSRNVSNNATGSSEVYVITSWSLLSISCLILVVTALSVLSNSSFKGRKTFRNYWTILLYAMFTNIPAKKALSIDENIAGGRHETIHSKEAVEKNAKKRLKSEYIFVDFNAWQYVGSDMLWAGIILNLVQAIEEKFGTVVVRLFRMLQDGNDCLDNDPYYDEQHNGFYLERDHRDFSKIKDHLEQFGVLQTFEQNKNTWLVKFDDPVDERTAFHNLNINGFSVSNERSDVKHPSVQYETTTYSGGKRSGIVPPVKTLTAKNDSNALNFCRYQSTHPRRVWCGCRYLYCLLLFVVSLVVTLIGSIVMMAKSFGSKLKAQDESDLTRGKTIIAVLPPTLIGTFVILRFGWAMFNSQIRRISSAVNGAKGSITAGLGLMNTIKEEVIVLSKLINVIRFTHQIDYKVVITVDDLDRCPLDLVKKILEAINVLLSDESSPFICIVVANSRVVSKCIEGGMEQALIKANITGHEYMKKIINLPFCIPSVESLRRFCEGTNDLADGASYRAEDDVDCPESGDENGSMKSPRSPFAPMEFDPTILRRNADRISFEDFQKKCRELLEGKDKDGECIHRHLSSNPRNIKRITNVLMITIRLIETTRKRAEFFAFLSPEQSEFIGVGEFGNFDDDAEDLVKWIVLTDQWPFLVSCLLYYMQDVHIYQDGYQRDRAEKSSLLELFEEQEKRLKDFEKCCKLSSLDCNRNLLKSFLLDCSSLTVARVKTLLHFTVNLDLSLKQEISFLMK